MTDLILFTCIVEMAEDMLGSDLTVHTGNDELRWLAVHNDFRLCTI